MNYVRTRMCGPIYQKRGETLIGSGNWIVDNLNSALETWNGELAELWTLVSMSPEDFKSGGVWSVILDIHGARGRRHENLRQLCRTEEAGAGL